MIKSCRERDKWNKEKKDKEEKWGIEKVKKN